MGTAAGELFGVRQPQAGEETRIPIVLLDSNGDRVTGIAYNAAGMTVEYCKDGASTFTPFVLASANWDEIGHGLYCILLRGNTPAEAAILDTEGLLAWYIACDGTRGDIFVVNVNRADVSRPGDAMSLIDNALTAEAVADSGAAKIAAAFEGAGVLAVPFYLEDDDGEPIPNTYCTVRVGTTLLAFGRTNSSGVFYAQLDPGEYAVWIGPTSLYVTENPYTVTVTDETQQTLTLDKVAPIPIPEDPSLCSCYIDIRYAAGTNAGELVGENEAWIDILGVTSKSDIFPSTTTPAVALDGERVYSDENGRVLFQAIRGVGLRLSLTRPWSVNDGEINHSVVMTVPDAPTYYIKLGESEN